MSIILSSIAKNIKYIHSSTLHKLVKSLLPVTREIG